ncbi:matrix-remodeling-associated protein 5 [Chanos chanos]|uniref:Matrix-remodeling-associated protein 5 n=1 Tax=Chanos chanos TaxID=29144 RepID=A0A6J2UML0_CHACN|nr:matrix-remodeling-associated protein 5-like [Chanos chanos]
MPVPRLLAPLVLMVILPACLCACPRSCSCPGQKEVHCTFRHLPSIPHNIPKDTQRVNLGYNNIEAVRTSDFANLHQLEMLMLHGNDITTVASGSFYHLRSLQILKLSYNKLKTIDAGMLEGLTSLVRLHLDHNLIDFIEPFSFNGLTSLKLLQLEGNRLQDLHPQTFITLSILGNFWGSTLRHLYLAENRLDYLLPGTLQHLSKLEVISLHGNPWTCDCHLEWLIEWKKKHEGIVKCKKDRDSAASEICAVCSSPQLLNNTQIFQLTKEKLTCERPSLQSPLKIGESSIWEDLEPDLPYIKDLESPLGQLTFVLSDSHGNVAHVACDVSRPTESTSMVWEHLKKSEQVEVNVTLISLLECEIDKEALQNLWRLVAYYYESPAILERGLKHENTSRVTYRYSQVSSEDSPYFTDLKGHLTANPTWLLQPRVTLQLNRQKTTTRKLVLNFSTFITKRISGRGEQEDVISSWAMIQRRTPGRIQSVLEHSDASMDCSVLSSGHQPVRWMLPDLTTLDNSDSKRDVSEHSKLIIKNTSLSDSGMYHCFIQTDTEVDIVSFRLTVRTNLLSPSDLNGKKMSVESGESLTLPCYVNSPQPSETKWFLPNNQILGSSEPNGKAYVSQNNSLVIEKVTHEDAGEYSCLAANLYGVDMLSHLVVVTGEKVKDPPDISVAEGESPLFEGEENEGSGFQEIKRPTSKKTQQRVDGKHRSSGGLLRPGTKGKRIKETVRKPNKSVKELDPHRWAEFLAKVNVKVSTAQPFPITMTTATKSTTAESVTQTTYIFTTNASPTTITEGTSSPTSISSPGVQSEKSFDKGTYVEKEGTRHRDPLHHREDYSNIPEVISLNPESTSASPIVPAAKNVTQPQKQVDRYELEERIKANNNPIWTQRRRPTFRRRRPPLHRFRPQRPTLPPSTTEYIQFSKSLSPTKVSEFTQRKEEETKATGKNKEDTAIKLKGSSQLDLLTEEPPQVYTILGVTLEPIQNKLHGRENSEDISWGSDKTEDKTKQHSLTVKTTNSPYLYHTNVKSPLSPKITVTTVKPVLTETVRHRMDKPKTRLENSDYSNGFPIHPWINQQHTQKRTQTSLKQQPFTPPPFWLYTDRAPLSPTDYSSRQRYSPDRPWHFHYTGGRVTEVTNRPEITAETAKPTAYISGSTATAFPLTLPPHSSSSPRARDFLLFSRLRNRYRQSQIDAYRLSQLGKPVTSKPSVTKPTPHQAPKLPSVYKSVTPPSIPVSVNKPQSTTSVFYGSRWHHSYFGTKKLSTALPFPNLMGNGLKPRITSANSVSVSALAETDISIPCESSGDPEPSLSWTQVSTGISIPANTKHGQRFEVHSNGTFVIKNVQLQDRGQYLCTAQNKFGSDRMVITLTVQTQPPKIYGVKAKDISVYLGKPINLDCVAVGKPKAQISWILPDRSFVREVGSFAKAASFFPNGTLSIKSANFSNKGDYMCIASNAAGADTVTYHIHVAALPPTITEGATESIAIQSGRSVYLHCTAKGEPMPLLKWSLPDGAHMKPTQFLGRRLFVFPNGTLFIKSVVPLDSGRYECSATNVVGSAKRVLQLDIGQETPIPWQRPSQQHSVKAMYGSTVFLHCPESAGSQRGTVWRLPSKILLEHRYSPQRHITAFPNGTVRILQLTEKDAGSYLCIFQRPNGEDMELFQVEVLMKPPKIENAGAQQKRVANGENFQVDCVASGLPDPEVSWSLPDGTVINNALQSDDSGTRSQRYIIFGNGTLLLHQMDKKDEGDYTCYAKNTLGEDEMRVSVKVISNSPKTSSKDQLTIFAPLGESVYMKCDALRKSQPTIIWLSPRNDIITSNPIKYQIMNDGTLVIKKVNLSDQGKYACVARNSAGDNIKNVMLQIEDRAPRINGKKGQTNMKILAVSYQTLLLDCKAEGVPEPQITWTTSYGMSLPTPYLGGRFQVHKNGSLELRGIRKADEGQFLCVATNYLGEASLGFDLEVASLAEKPSFSVPNIEVLPLRPDGGDITLECHATGKPKPELAWILPNSTVMAPGLRLQRFIHYPENGTLRIIQPVTNDKGVYRCLAKNVAGQVEKRYALEPGRKPQIRGTAGAMKISFGQTLNMPCTVDGWPEATITWTLPNGLVLDKPQVIERVTYLSNGTLQIRETAKSDRGTYLCKATNTFGTSILSYPVTVMVFPPRITNAPPSIIRVNKGSPVTLNCIASGIPKPDISWTLPGRTTLVPSNRFATQGGIHMTVEGSLVIQDPGLMNSGIYKCNAKNALGTDFKATYLQVI